VVGEIGEEGLGIGCEERLVGFGERDRLVVDVKRDLAGIAEETN
jgi:hypothetical protein